MYVYCTVCTGPKYVYQNKNIFIEIDILQQNNISRYKHIEYKYVFEKLK